MNEILCRAIIARCEEYLSHWRNKEREASTEVERQFWSGKILGMDLAIVIVDNVLKIPTTKG